ncbi:MAG: glycosyltransferase [Candidatus Sumerlaeaceae bacterium]|nr:glycosyltransferase [Candidatus Sumerlaeaceae bacterium]
MAKFSVLFPASEVTESVKDGLESLRRQSTDDWACYIVPTGSPDAVASLADAGASGQIRIAPTGLDTLAKMLNWAANETGAEYVFALPDRIELAPKALETIAKVFSSKAKAACVYASFAEEDTSGNRKEVHLHPHEGAFHERFDFGYIKVYRADRLKEIGGFREDLKHAAEYDADLKLTDNYTIELAKQILYTVSLAPPDPNEKAAPAGLYSPGKGKLGGFSYVFYPADLEAEVTGVFEQMLKRRGAWIDHDTVPVKYPKKDYPVLGSVIIPVLNRVKFIGNAIERVLEGTFTNFEVIVIDNGSTDGTQDLVRTYIEKDPRVKLIVQKGPSIAYALNTGIRMACGKYICQLDSDDEYKPDTLEKMIGHFESHPKCGLAISYYELMEENRDPVVGVDPVTHSGYTRNQILRRDGAGALRVFPKAVLEEMGYYDEENFGNFGEDYDMVLKTGEKYDVDRVHAVLYRYRRHPDNTDVTRDPIMKVRNKNNARLNALKRRQKINKKLKKA